MLLFEKQLDITDLQKIIKNKKHQEKEYNKLIKKQEKIIKKQDQSNHPSSKEVEYNKIIKEQEKEQEKKNNKLIKEQEKEQEKLIKNQELQEKEYNKLIKEQEKEQEKIIKNQEKILKKQENQEKKEKMKQKELQSEQDKIIKNQEKKEKQEKLKQKELQSEQDKIIKKQETQDKIRQKELIIQNKQVEKLYKIKTENEKKDLLISKKKLEIDEVIKKSRFAENDSEASMLIYEDLKDNVKSVEGIIYYRCKNNVWSSNLKTINGEILNYIMNDSNIRRKIERIDNVPIIKDYSQNTSSAINIRIAFIAKLSARNDTRWLMSAHESSLGKVLYKNGYLDFHNRKFVSNNDADYDYDVSFFEIVDRNYIAISSDENSDERKALEIHKDNLFYKPFTKELGDWYILKLARGMAGDAQKMVLFGIGNSNSGKSLLTSTLKDSFGGYVSGYNGENLIYKKNSNTDEAANMRWVYLLRSKRIVFSSEIKMGCQIDGNILKKLSNGGKDELTGREHCQNEQTFKVFFLPIVFANDIDDIKPCDDAVVKRIKSIPYNKVFVDENPENEYEMKKTDEYNSDSGKSILKTDEFINCFVQILFDSYCNFISNGRVDVEPELITASRKNVIGDVQVDLIKGFLELFDITNNVTDSTPSYIIEDEYLKPRGISVKKFNNEINKFFSMERNKGKFDNVDSSVIKHITELGGKCRRCWVGIAKKE